MSEAIPPPPPGMPEGKPTTQLARDEILAGLVKSLEHTMKSGLQEVAANVDIMGNEVKALSQRVSFLERRADDDDARASRFSERARQTSEVDLRHEAKIAEEVQHRIRLEAELADTKGKVEAIAVETKTQTEILERLSRIASNPVVKQLATALATAALTWLSMRGLPR